MILPPNIFMSPEYLQGYQDGYEQAKLFMMETIKRMQGLSEQTSTMTAIEEKDNTLAIIEFVEACGGLERVKEVMKKVKEIA